MAETAKTTKTTEVTKYTKEQLRSSKKYRTDVDILGVVLEDDKSYTFEETDKLIKNFKERKVK
ncbi:MAG: hypothetical protein Q4D26_09195 [Clostridia bacterium]|nr:hypothetical protein [Clostridia bacterium]